MRAAFTLQYVFPDVNDFLRELAPRYKSKADQQLLLLQEYGTLLAFPFSRKIAENLYELRISTGIQIRVFYCFTGTTIVPLHAFIKKTQKLPRKELKRALSRKRLLEII